MSNSVSTVEEIGHYDKYWHHSEIRVKDEISAFTKRNWNLVSEFPPSEAVVFEFNLTRYSLKIDSVVLCSDLKPVAVHRSRLRGGVDSLMHKVIEVTEEALN